MPSDVSMDVVGGSGSPERRSFLNWLLGLWATGVAAAVLYPVMRYLVPPEIPEAATQSVTGGKASTLLPNAGRIVPFGSAPAIIIRTAAGEYRAFAAVCTTCLYRAVSSRP